MLMQSVMTSLLVAQVRNAPQGVVGFLLVTGMFCFFAWWFISAGIAGVRDRRFTFKGNVVDGNTAFVLGIVLLVAGIPCALAALCLVFAMVANLTGLVGR